MKVRKKYGLVIANFTKNYLKDLDNLRNKLLERREVAERWKIPEKPRVKLNFDVAYRIQEKKSCSALACIQAIQMGLDLGIRVAEVKANSLTVVKKA
ncbi:hypothetical protein Golax_013801 [Gossypium laxum]|uniref:RNase H type-1 domain-containing protein n=1 Tax=Gossypium laxum TaxID=34288 RepID=A0A7J8ZT89_9ROSI|nr:hypothetical protein [Gossypium laxum]